MISQTQAARQLGISPFAASVIIRTQEIPTFPCPNNGKTKLLDDDGFCRLAVAATKIKLIDRAAAAS